RLLSDVYIHNEYFEQVLEFKGDFFCTEHRTGFVSRENFSQHYVDLFTGRRDNKNLFEFIQCVADLTVSININVYQEERYKYVYCKPSFGLLGLERSTDIFGSGIVYRIDRSCQNINVNFREFPAMKNVCADIYIATAAHLVPDQLAYSIAECVFFFDSSSDGASPSYVHKVVEYNAKDNWCLLRLRTYNMQLIERLENVMEKFDALRVKIYNEYKGSRDDERLMFSVSHPYGSDKHISLGRWESLEVKNDIWSTFTYQAPMFPGSAGAYVHMLGYSGRVWHYPHLHRCNKQSGAGYHVQ
ncbi:STE20 serine/threonine-protein kinase isoform X2, partial [Biomphalaria glabrata]